MRGTLPPQAYTREVLAQAYTWLQAQGESVRGMAQSPDALVSLYLRMKRSQHNLEMADQLQLDREAPVSSENFRSQLKTLASDLQQFSPENEHVPEMSLSHSVPPPMARREDLSPKKTMMPRESFRESTKESNGLDPRSQEMVLRVKQHLNLSSDAEALRMLIVLGFEKIQGVLSS